MKTTASCATLSKAARHHQPVTHGQRRPGCLTSTRIMKTAILNTTIGTIILSPLSEESFRSFAQLTLLDKFAKLIEGSDGDSRLFLTESTHQSVNFIEISALDT